MKCLVLSGLFTLLGYHILQAQTKVDAWLTTIDTAHRLQPQIPLQFTTTPPSNIPTIHIYPDTSYQQMDGFGFALTGGSAQHIIRMGASERQQLLQELFGTNNGDIGISYLRVSMGASDLNEFVFSYNDLPTGKTDVTLQHFDLKQDKLDVIPVLQAILRINPRIKIMASPWSAPTWMKTNNNIQGGRLKNEYYEVYAQYFVKYIQAMQAQGIHIDAITIQNEPFNDGNTPSMQMFAKEQARFIKQHLGPAFKKNHINTKIILYDHNCDAPAYPISILTDPEARQYIDGSGFHLYAGNVSAMSKVHMAFPEKHLYFTEMMAVNRKEFNVAIPTDRIVVGATRNWSRNVILWNLAADANNKPHTDNGGCSICQGAITIEGNQVQRNIAYYTIAHVSKFIPPASTRIQSSEVNNVSNVTFKTPGGKIVCLVANKNTAAQSFLVAYQHQSFNYTLPAGAVVTFVW
ncbi:glucosylceramidase [Chitinophaga skermanii]|uniref:Glucosylceramidase n=1 Tax=Chitinophaga skermanii TaxID=331697 RepID=A0A327R1M5_9BACT|nr:glycoside hydrolase family 30 beta sandwich domain-containing protein [Chitinophaga skermanii]RAJ10560.1 glucosylceramidase [Chitinophaga skermanii]